MLDTICEINRPIQHSLPVWIPAEYFADDCADATTKVLIIEEHPRRMSEQLRRAFLAPEYRIQVACVGPDAQLPHICAKTQDVILLCLGLRNSSELEIYRQIRRMVPCLPVIFVANAGQAGRADVAIEAIKEGAYDFLFQPIEPSMLRRVVAEAMNVARGRGHESDVAIQSETDLDGEGHFVGRCPAMAEVYKAVGRVAAQNMPVLVTGESGTGKEVVARAIHRHSGRCDKPFLAINCAAIPESLLESELFGHEKGAFTGADRRRIGKFEQCNGGTHLLDEIGDMPLSLQGKMLRLLQDQTFERVGGNETIQTDVRVIAATNRDLKAMAEQGKFRPDLYYRLGVFTIGLPALRERGDDVPMLVHHYLRRFNREMNRDVREVAPEAMERLRSYRWPGNIRELQSVVKQSLLRATGSVLLPTFLPDLVSLESSQATAPAECDAKDWSELRNFIRQRLEAGSIDLGAEVQLEIDRILLPAVLQFTNRNQFQAARILGIARQTLRLRLRSIGLSLLKTFAEEPA